MNNKLLTSLLVAEFISAAGTQLVTSHRSLVTSHWTQVSNNSLRPVANAENDGGLMSQSGMDFPLRARLTRLIKTDRAKYLRLINEFATKLDHINNDDLVSLLWFGDLVKGSEQYFKRGSLCPLNALAAEKLLTRSTNSFEVVKKLIFIAEKDTGVAQKLSLSVLASSDNALAREYIKKNIGATRVSFNVLDKKTIRDKTGACYTIRIRTIPTIGILIAVDAPFRVNTNLSDWKILCEFDGIRCKWASYIVDQNTVAYFVCEYSDLGELGFSYDEGLNAKDIKFWLNNLDLSVAETAPSFQGRGIYRSFIRQLDTVVPKGEYLTCRSVTEPRTVELLNGGGKFFETVIGKPFAGTAFVVVDIHKTGNASYDVLLQKIADIEDFAPPIPQVESGTFPKGTHQRDASACI